MEACRRAQDEAKARASSQAEGIRELAQEVADAEPRVAERELALVRAEQELRDLKDQVQRAASERLSLEQKVRELDYTCENIAK